MSPNPFHRSRHKQADEEDPFRASAWGEPLSWPVPRAEGEPLTFQLRLPVEIELVDLASLAVSAREAAPIAAQRAAVLERASAAVGVVLIGALRPSDMPAARRPILATLTVAFSEQVTGPPSDEDLPVADSEPATGSPEGVTSVADKAKLITYSNRESLGEGMDPVPVRTWQYLIETGYGGLVMVFSTADRQMWGKPARSLYRRIVDTTFLGEQAPAA